MKKEESIVKVNENSLMYRIKQFIHNIFHKKEKDEVEITIQEDKKQKEESIPNTLKQEFKDELIVKQDNHVEIWAHQIKEGKINPEDFSEEELDEIIEYFEESINQKQNKLEAIKNKIIALKQEMN